jgi:L-rhamnose mutarotase
MEQSRQRSGGESVKILGLVLGLKDGEGVVEEYRRAHTAVPPVVTEGLRAAGVKRMEIFLLGGRLFMRLEVDDAFDPRASFAASEDGAAVEHDPVYAEFDARMRAIQQPVAEAEPGAWWALMDLVYEFSGQPD